jgi:hypothetical protein
MNGESSGHVLPLQPRVVLRTTHLSDLHHVWPLKVLPDGTHLSYKESKLWVRARTKARAR